MNVQRMELALRSTGRYQNGADNQLTIHTYKKFLMDIRKKADKANRRAHKRHKQDWVKLGLTGNVVLQKHFRDRNIVFG